MPVVQLEKVSVQLGAVEALKEVSLHIAAGERVALVGPNGSGKSTLLRTLHGLLSPVAGTARRDPLRRQAMLFQRPHLLRISALANVALGLWLDRSLGLTWQEARERAGQAMARVGLQGIAAQGGRQLSGGQQQRVFLARAIAQEADLLLFDEPFNNVDPQTETIIFDIFAELKAQQKTLLVISHDLSETLDNYDQLLLINKRLIAAGTKEEVLTNENINQAYNKYFSCKL